MYKKTKLFILALLAVFLLIPARSDASTRRSILGANEQKAYDILKEQITQVAEGKSASSVFTIPLKDVFGNTDTKFYTAEELGLDTLTDNGEVSALAANTLLDKYPLDLQYPLNLQKISAALSIDCPYELFWFDCVSGSGGGYKCSFLVKTTDGVERIALVDPVYEQAMAVSVDYSASGAPATTDLNTAKTKAVAATIAKAQAIIKKHQYESDYNKLESYCKEICSLVSYDTALAASGSAYYGNQWQLTNVFDGDPSTKVVCEGYSRAFKYLCDHSTFKSSQVECHIVTGTMTYLNRKQVHMWCIVKMDDRRCYLADITNSDQGTAGEAKELFIAAPTTGSVAGGYTFRADDENVYYSYDSQTRELYGNDVLNLSTTAYDICKGNHQWNAGVISKKANTTQAGIKTFTCSACRQTRTESIPKATVMSVTAATKKVKASKLKKKAQTIAPIKVKNAIGALNYKISKGKAKAKKALKINKNTGKVTVKKGTKKGSYKVIVTITASGNNLIAAQSKKVNLTVKVK